MSPAKFFEGLLLFGVGLLVAGTSRLELDLAPSEELANAVGVRILDAVALSKELVGLRDRGDLPPLHGLLQVLEGLWRDQFLPATLMHPALEQFLKPSLPVAGEPPLALTPRVAQRLGDLPQVRALLGFEESEHPDPLEEVRIAMVLFELL